MAYLDQVDVSSCNQPPRLKALLSRAVKALPKPRSQQRFCELVREGRLAQVKASLESMPALCDSYDATGLPALVVAIEEELPIITRLLVQFGANPTARCRKAGRLNDTPLTVSLRQRRPFITKLLVERYLYSEFLDTQQFLSMRNLESNFRSTRDKKTVRRALVEVYADMRIGALWQAPAATVFE